jgi:phosphate-selective porin OprO/OprP
MERALPNTFVLDRRVGAGVSSRGNRWTASAGIFGESFGEDAAAEGDEGWAASGRFTFAPIQSDTRLFHIGASAAYQVPGDAKEVRISAKPESHLTDATFLNTGRIRNVRDQFTCGIESAMIYGPFSLQWEYMHSSLNINNSNESPAFQGGYAFASWMITGESRNYKFKNGAFGRITPDRTYGALELAVRYSVLDLNSRPLVLGGREDNVTLAFNWYINRNIRLMTNYVLFNNDLHANDRGDLAEDDDAGVFQARLQLDF